jgi:thiol-disulfide isomerase/thioredoxin
MKNTLVCAAAFALMFILAACSNQPTPQATPSASPTAAAPAPIPKGVPEISAVQKRDNKAPNFSWTDSTGKTVSFDGVRTKVNFINFWATWCGPCKAELPDLVALSKEYEGKNVKFFGLSVDRGGDVGMDVQKFAADHDIPYTVLVANDDVQEAFGNITGIPTSFIVDGDGNIKQTYVGLRNKDFLKQALDKELQ